MRVRLLSGVRSVTFRFMSPSLEWVEFAVGERGRRPPQRHMAKPHVHKKPKHLRDGLNRDTHEASLTRDLQSRRKILCRTGMNLPKREAQRTRFERSRP